LPAKKPRWRFVRKGFYTRSSDLRRVQRFQCRTCGVNFSSQTFSTSYWQKRPELTKRIFLLSLGCMATRQIARTVKASPQTVSEHIARLARHAMLWQVARTSGVKAEGPVVIDGLRSFEYSQYHPIEHHVAVEKDTSFVLYHTESELRRSGRMTPYQRRKRRKIEQRIGRPDPQTVRKDVGELLEVSLEGLSCAIVHSDEHHAYKQAIRKLELSVTHRVTNSKKRRTQHNPLYEINLLDLWIRHAQSNHKRETIAASKRRQASAEKLSLLQLWKNFIQRRRVNGPPQTPAMLKGLIDRPLSIAEIYQRRLFPGRIALPPRWQLYYRREVRTREYPNNGVHQLKYAF
jgi:transposase-like protein